MRIAAIRLMCVETQNISVFTHHIPCCSHCLNLGIMRGILLYYTECAATHEFKIDRTVEIKKSSLAHSRHRQIKYGRCIQPCWSACRRNRCDNSCNPLLEIYTKKTTRQVEVKRKTERRNDLKCNYWSKSAMRARLS